MRDRFYHLAEPSSRRLSDKAGRAGVMIMSLLSSPMSSADGSAFVQTVGSTLPAVGFMVVMD